MTGMGRAGAAVRAGAGRLGARVRRLARASAGPAGIAVGVAVRAAPGVGGLGLVAAGAWMAWHPAGLIVGGLGLLADSVASRVRPGRAGAG